MNVTNKIWWSLSQLFVRFVLLWFETWNTYQRQVPLKSITMISTIQSGINSPRPFVHLDHLFFINVFWFRNRHLPVFVSKLQLSERFSDIMILDLISTKPSSLCELLYTYKGSHGCLADNLSYMVFSGYVKESNIFIKMGFETSLVPLTI